VAAESKPNSEDNMKNIKLKDSRMFGAKMKRISKYNFFSFKQIVRTKTLAIRTVPAGPEFDSGQGNRDGRKLDIWHLFWFICQGSGLR
jgi:hypothetical protein